MYLLCAVGLSHPNSVRIYEKGIFYYKVFCLAKKTIPGPIYNILYHLIGEMRNLTASIRFNGFKKLVYGGNQFANIDKARLIKTL